MDELCCNVKIPERHRGSEGRREKEVEGRGGGVHQDGEDGVCRRAVQSVEASNLKA